MSENNNFNKDMNNSDNKNENAKSNSNNNNASGQNSSGNQKNDKVIVILKSRLNNRNFKKNFKKKKNIIKEDKIPSEVVQIKRVVKVVRGGRRFKFSVIIIVGNKKNKFGYAIGKANEIPIAIRKAYNKAKENMVNVNIDLKNKSIAHPILGEYKSTKVYLYSAKKGTGVIAGGTTRIILKLAGIENIYSKIHGSRNKLNVIKATMDGLCKLKSRKWLLSIKNIIKN